MNKNFYHKYLKYKNKYLKLSKKYKNQVGGNVVSKEEIIQLVDIVNNSELIKIYKENVNKIRKYLIDNKVSVYPTSLYILEFINNKSEMKYNKELEFFRKHNLKIMGSSYRWIYIFENPDVTLKQFYWNTNLNFKDSSDYKELEFMKKINYPFSSKLLYNDIIKRNDDKLEVYYIAMNTIKGVDLVDIKEIIPLFNLQHFKDFLLQMCMINYYLHINGIVHLDLKLDNYILDDEKFLNVIDFGSTKCLNKKCDPNTKLKEPRIFYEKIGTIGYRLPKQFNFLKEKYSFEFDYYSTIISLLALLLKVNPADIENKAIESYKHNKGNVLNDIMIYMSKNYQILILKDYINKNNDISNNLIKHYNNLSDQIIKLEENEKELIDKYNTLEDNKSDIISTVKLLEQEKRSIILTKLKSLKNNDENLDKIKQLDNVRKIKEDQITKNNENIKIIDEEIEILYRRIILIKNNIYILVNKQLEECNNIARSDKIEYITQLNNIVKYLFGKEFESFSNNCKEIEVITKKYCSYLCVENCGDFTKKNPHKYIIYILLGFFGDETYNFDKLEECFSFIDDLNNNMNDKTIVKEKLKQKIRSIYK